MFVRSSIVGLAENITFVKKPGIYKKGNVHYVGKIIPLTRIHGCSPVYKDGDKGLTALHCIADGCRLRGGVYDDNDPVVVKDYIKYTYCRDWLCGILARFRLNEIVMLPRCIERYDHAWVDKYRTYKDPVGILFAGSTVGNLALILSDQNIRGKEVEIISYDYEEKKEIRWEARINGRGLFKVDFKDGVLWYQSYYIYPTPVKVKPGFSGSNVFLKSL